MRAALLLVAFAICVASCGGAPAVFVRAWTFQQGSMPPVAVELPRHLDRELPNEPVDYVLRSRVELPDALRGQELTFAILFVPARIALEADGQRIPLASASLLDGHRKVGPHKWRIPAELTRDGALELTLTVEHRAVYTAWLDTVPELTTAPSGTPGLSMRAAWNDATAVAALATSLLLMVGGFLSAGLHARLRPLLGWLAVAGLSGASYPAFFLGLTQVVFGTYDPLFLAVAMCVSSVAGLEITHCYFGLERASRWWWAAVAGVAVGGTLFGDPFRAARFGGTAGVVMFVATVVGQVVVVRRISRGRRQARHVNLKLVAIVWPLAVALSLPDLAAVTGFGELAGGLRTGCMAMIVLVVGQATAVNRDNLANLLLAETLNEQLAERVRTVEAKNVEVEHLNEELQRQIAARGEELAASLIRLEGRRDALRLAEGDVVDDRYTVIGAIGTGGMGVVYEVERAGDGRRFALKVLSGIEHGRARARLAREAQLAASVSHPNVVMVADIAVSRTGFLYLVMELVSGTSAALAKDRWGELDWAVPVLAQTAEGLAAIHARGIVHRDIKPANVLLCTAKPGGEPVAKIADFGISSLLDADDTDDADDDRAPVPARRADGSAVDMNAETVTGDDTAAGRPPPEHSEMRPSARKLRAEDPAARVAGPRGVSLTETGVLIGTPSYMAPELATGSKRAVSSSDVFSFGVVAYLLLTREPPFETPPILALRAGERPRPARSLAERCPGLPRELSSVLERAVDLEPGRRPSAREIADALATRRGASRG